MLCGLLSRLLEDNRAQLVSRRSRLMPSEEMIGCDCSGCVRNPGSASGTHAGRGGAAGPVRKPLPVTLKVITVNNEPQLVSSSTQGSVETRRRRLVIVVLMDTVAFRLPVFALRATLGVAPALAVRTSARPPARDSLGPFVILCHSASTPDWSAAVSAGWP